MLKLRDIEDILFFRTDISPFLVHLTRNNKNDDNDNTIVARENLKKILKEKMLKQGKTLISDIRFVTNNSDWPEDKKAKYFSAVSLTETPLNEIHCLFDIKARKNKLLPYGLVFLKDNLRDKGASPVFYINNYCNETDKVPIVKALASLIDTHPDESAQIIPLFSIFGNKITPPSSNKQQSGIVDFYWEREWRYPYINGDFDFDTKDIFIGLCPHDEIDDFEKLSEETYGKKNTIKFVDPTRNMKYYADKLIVSRKRSEIKYSVV